MNQLTTDNLKSTLREVLADTRALEPVIAPIVQRAIAEYSEAAEERLIVRMTDKFEKVLGVDCTDVKAREETRKTMEFAQRARLYFDDDGGHERFIHLQKVLKLFDDAVTNVIRYVVYTICIGLIVTGSAGVVNPDILKKLKSLFP